MPADELGPNCHCFAIEGGSSGTNLAHGAWDRIHALLKEPRGGVILLGC